MQVNLNAGYLPFQRYLVEGFTHNKVASDWVILKITPYKILDSSSGLLQELKQLYFTRLLYLQNPEPRRSKDFLYLFLTLKPSQLLQCKVSKINAFQIFLLRQIFSYVAIEVVFFSTFHAKFMNDVLFKVYFGLMVDTHFVMYFP